MFMYGVFTCAVLLVHGEAYMLTCRPAQSEERDQAGGNETVGREETVTRPPRSR